MQWTCQEGEAAKFRKMSECEQKDRDLLVAVAELFLKSAEEEKELQAACFRTILVLQIVSLDPQRGPDLDLPPTSTCQVCILFRAVNAIQAPPIAASAFFVILCF